MALPMTPSSSWTQNLDFPSQLFATGRDGYELYEEDDEFVLSVEMPGFDLDDISVSWNEGVLNIAAETENEERGQRKTYHRRFRFPKSIEDDAITASYTNGVLEVRLPVETAAPISGQEIEIHG